MELTEQNLKLVRAIVSKYIGDSEQNKPHSGVDQLLMGGVIIECRKLVADIDAELESRKEPFVPNLVSVEG